MTTILLDILPMVFSLIMGAYTTHKKQEAEDLHLERIYALKATAAARADKSRGASYSRKFIVQSVIGSLFLFPMILTILNFFGHLYGVDPVAIYVPKEVMYGGLLSLIFTAEAVEYIPIHGFVLMPIHILIAQIITGYYFGASAMKR